MQRTCPHLAPILRRCGAELAHCIRLHIFRAEIWLSAGGGRGKLGLRRYSRAADVNNLRRNESWPTAAATSTRRPRQSGRNISRKSRFSTQDLFGATEWECEQAAGAGTVRKREGGEGGELLQAVRAVSLWVRHRFRTFTKFRIAALYDSCARFSRRICMERFARDLSMIARLKIPQIYLLLNAMTNQFVAPGAATLCQQLI